MCNLLSNTFSVKKVFSCDKWSFLFCILLNIIFFIFSPFPSWHDSNKCRADFESTNSTKKLHEQQKSVRTELDGAGALSRLSITQANVRHSGIYTCSVSDTISQSLRLHIIDGECLKIRVIKPSHTYIKRKKSVVSLFLIF